MTRLCYAHNWTTWTDITNSRSLSAGQNTIRLESTTANGLANIDYLKMTGNNITGVSCAGVQLRTSTTEEITTTLKTSSLVYPNPSAGVFIISSPGKFDYLILDQQGKQIEKGVGDNKANVGAMLKPGVYFIKVLKNGNTEMLKVVKR